MEVAHFCCLSHVRCSVNIMLYESNVVLSTGSTHGTNPHKGGSFNHHQRTSSLTTSFTDSEDPLRLSFGDLKDPGSDYEVVDNN